MKEQVLIDKQEKLQNLKVQLKKEFIGIDAVIDEVITAISPWYLFNDLQQQPLVVNLWGLTGTGKTSLVKRLSQLLHKEKAFYRFDLSNPKKSNIKRKLSDVEEYYDRDDFIICLDEFQHLRTKTEMGNEKNIELDFDLWNLLDTGEFEKTYSILDQENYLRSANILKAWIGHGIKIRNGSIDLDEQPKDIRSTLKAHLNLKEKESTYEYFNFRERREMFSLLKDRFSDIVAFEQFYHNSDEHQLLQLLCDLSERDKKQQKAQLSKSLIFVVGNLDEAYKMSKNFNPDICADEFHRESLKINISQIKKALQKRFRNEQIARLGNNHIIYPALQKRSYRKIIGQHLKKSAEQFQELTGIQLTFDPSVHGMIYKNGVYPTQGVRPLKSTLKHYIDAQIGKMLARIPGISAKVDKLFISYHPSSLRIDYFANASIVDELLLPVDVALDKIRSSANANRKILTAVHEAGHAVISIALLHEIPDQLHCNAADTESMGFTMMGSDDDRIRTRAVIISSAARCLGGLEAERLLFGEEMISIGASSDMAIATDIISQAIHENGLGDKLGFFAKNNNKVEFAFTTSTDALEQEAERLLHEAKKLAQEKLSAEKHLLIKIADELAKKQKLDKQQLEELIQAFSKTTTLDDIRRSKQAAPYLEKFEAERSALPALNNIEERLVHNVKSFMKDLSSNNGINGKT